MISIVIPVYNGEKYLADCINSALNQTYEDKEIIVINDGSTDRTEEIALQYKDKIRYYYKNNGGTASALNEGIKQMKGSWFKWLSADDMFYDRNSLQTMMTMIGTIPDHQRYVFYTNYEIVNQDGIKIKYFQEPDRIHLGTDLRNVELLHNFYGNGSSSLIPNDIINKIGLFRENMTYGEDLEYWLRACLKFKYTLYHLPLCSIKYRIHGDSLTNTAINTKSYNALQEIKKEFAQYLTEDQRQHLQELKDAQPLRRKIIPFSMRSSLLKIRNRIR